MVGIMFVLYAMNREGEIETTIQEQFYYEKAPTVSEILKDLDDWSSDNLTIYTYEKGYKRRCWRNDWYYTSEEDEAYDTTYRNN